MAPQKQTAVVVDETNKKNPDPKVQIVEKDIPTPGQGEVLVRITLRPVMPCFQLSCHRLVTGRSRSLKGHYCCRCTRQTSHQWDWCMAASNLRASLQHLGMRSAPSRAQPWKIVQPDQ